MIELVFSDSAAAALSIAQSSHSVIGAQGVLITCNDETGETTMEPYTPPPYPGPYLDGSPEEILPLALMADVGDLSDLSANWDSRLRLWRAVAQSHCDGYPGYTADWVPEFFGKLQQARETMMRAIHEKTPIRVWWSDSADETCGFHWVMTLLQDAQGPVYSVKIPLLHDQNGALAETRGTASLEPGELVRLAKTAVLVSPAQRQFAALHWERLVRENAPLRAVINGTLCSVPDSFYDPFITRECTGQETKIITLIGKALGNGPTGVSDWWYGQRIRQMIHQGRLALTRESKYFYHSVVIPKTSLTV